MKKAYVKLFSKSAGCRNVVRLLQLARCSCDDIEKVRFKIAASKDKTRKKICLLIKSFMP